MKRILFFLGAIMLASVTLLTSCTEDDPVDLPPTISFLTADTLISANSTVYVNATFYVGINAVANTTSGSKIQSLRVVRISNNQVIGDQTFPYDDDNLSVVISFVALPETGTENIEFTVTDKDGQSAKKNLQITTQVVSGGEIDSWQQKILGSWSNTTIGSSFGSSNGNVYKLNEAFANQALIDFIYWWGETTDATIGAPNDGNAALVFNTGDYKLNNWTIKNATKFKTTTVNSAAFDAMTDAGDIIDIATGADQTRIGELSLDQVIAFVTVSGKHGLIRVKNIVINSNGSITIDVKVQK